MPRIKITEIDNTRPGGQSFGEDVVFIPGFVDMNNVYEEDQLIPYKQPVLFQTLADFETRCGTKPASFGSNQNYSDLDELGGFAGDAIPSDGTMFEENDYDPAYIMAKEILASGLPVVYERINERTKTIPTTSGSSTATNTGYVTYELYKKCDVSYGLPFSAPKASGTIVSDKTYIIKNTDLTNTGITALGYTYTKITGSELSALSLTAKTILGISGELFTDNCLVCELPNVFVNTTISEAKPDGTSGTITITMPAITGAKLVSTAEEQQPGIYFTESNDNIYQLWDIPITLSDEWVFYNKVTEIQEVNEYNTILVSEATYSFIYGETGNAQYYTDSQVSDTDNVDIKTFYSALNDIFAISDDNSILDRGNTSFKYLTSGGYPVFEFNNGELVTKMLAVCEKRGDCVALIDHTNKPERTTNINDSHSLYKAVQNSDSIKTNSDYGTMFTPWVDYNRITSDVNAADDSKATTTTHIELPASFAYLTCLADSIKTNANWLAIAGVSRGLVQNIADGGMTQFISNAAADNMQPRGANEGDKTVGIAINAITNIRPYGYTIWGNRTLVNNTEGLVAHSFLNIRNLVSDVKKLCYRVARRLTFEQNNDILWVNFKAGIAPLLDNMLSGYGISGYKFVRDYENEHANEKATLCAKIILIPTYAVEDFYITILLEDDEITVE